MAFVMAFRIQPGKKMFAMYLYIYSILSEKWSCLQLTSNHYIIHILSGNLGTHSEIIGTLKGLISRSLLLQNEHQHIKLNFCKLGLLLCICAFSR